MQKPASIYALLIGVAHYHPQTKVTPLKGALKDIENIETLLEDLYQPQYNIYTKKLINSHATRKNIIYAIIHHLAQATNQDLVLFYFSGHGSYTTTAKKWLNFHPNGQEEGLVCYDSRLENQWDLSDKELGWLLAQACEKSKHTLVCVDACHSGSITRNQHTARARFTPANTRPKEAQHYFYDVENTDLKIQLQNQTKLPDFEHIVLSACRRNEVAWEDNEGGFFTNALLQILKEEDGYICYKDLFELLQLKITQKSGNQNPQLEISGNLNDRQQFLKGKLLKKNVRRKITFQNHEWLINLGTIYGLPLDLQQPLKVHIYTDPDSLTPIGEALIKKLGFESSILTKVPHSMQRARQQIFWADWPHSQYPVLPLFFEGNHTQQQFLQALIDLKKLPSIRLTTVQNTRFQLLSKDNKIYELWDKTLNQLIAKFEFSKQLLSHSPKQLWDNYNAYLKATRATLFQLNIPKSIEQLLPDFETLLELLHYCDHLLQWQQTQQLRNSKSRIKLKFEFENLSKNEAQLVEQKPLKQQQIFKLSGNSMDYTLWVQNSSRRKYYGAVLYISESYGIHLITPQIEIPAQQEAPLQLIYEENGSLIIPEGRTQTHGYFKLIVSLHPIDHLNILQLPDLNIGQNIHSQLLKRGAFRRNSLEDWQCFDISILLQQ